MTPQNREWLLQHLDDQARYLAALTGWARDNPADADVLLRVRDEVFTMRETLSTLAVPHAAVSNDDWGRAPHATHRAPWPSADDVPA